MNVGKIMRRDVAALRANTSIDAAWRRMREQRLDTLPVTNLVGHLLGVLTEQDLLMRLAPRRAPAWWRAIADDKDRLAGDYLKTVAATVGEIMQERSPAVVPDTPIETAATLMRRHALSALAVVANDVCVGLVTRADVLDHLPWPTSALPGTVADAELQCLIQEAINEELWASKSVTVEVVRGIIRLTGVVASAVQRAALLAMARSVAGGARVDDRVLVLSRAGRRMPVPVI